MVDLASPPGLFSSLQYCVDKPKDKHHSAQKRIENPESNSLGYLPLTNTLSSSALEVCSEVVLVSFSPFSSLVYLLWKYLLLAEQQSKQSLIQKHYIQFSSLHKIADLTDFLAHTLRDFSFF